MNSNSLPETRKEILNDLIRVEYLPQITVEEIFDNNYSRVSVGSMASLASALSELSQEGVYRVVFPKGVHGSLAVAKDGSGNLGAIINEKGIAGQARFIKAGINPTSLFMATAVMSIDQKINDIKELQQELLDFLHRDKESKIIGDLHSLSDALNQFKFNLENENFRMLKSNLVQSIKRESKSNIVFYERQIGSLINNINHEYFNKRIQGKNKTMQKHFKYYRLSVFLYSFASFMEVLLLGNFTKGYLENVVKDIGDYSFRYKKLYTGCYDIIEQKTKASIELRALGMSSKLEKSIEKSISKNELLRKIKVDSAHVKRIGRLHDMNVKMLNSTMSKFLDNKRDGAIVFIDRINILKNLYNEPLELYLDTQGMYLNNVELK